MSAGINDGGPAYPSARDMRHRPDFDHEPGMSLRDAFAMAALKGLLANEGCDYSPMTPLSRENVVRDAWLLADAMLAAREVKR